MDFFWCGVEDTGVSRWNGSSHPHGRISEVKVLYGEPEGFGIKSHPGFSIDSGFIIIIFFGFPELDIHWTAK